MKIVRILSILVLCTFTIFIVASEQETATPSITGYVVTLEDRQVYFDRKPLQTAMLKDAKDDMLQLYYAASEPIAYLLSDNRFVEADMVDRVYTAATAQENTPQQAADIAVSSAEVFVSDLGIYTVSPDGQLSPNVAFYIDENGKKVKENVATVVGRLI